VALRIGLAVILVAAGIAAIASGLVDPDQLQKNEAVLRPNLEAIVDVSAMQQRGMYFWLMLTFVSFVVAGLREELWRSAFLASLRQLWPNRFESRAGKIWAVSIAAVIFGMAHVTIMVFHGSIWPAVLAHGFFDATTMALIPWLAEFLK
jgi:membrane protease YdiL (CAAX protease family)